MEEKKYTIPAEKIEFMKKAIEELKAANKSDHESGDFDTFNHKSEGRYRAFEEVMHWVDEEVQQPGPVWVKASAKLPLHKAFWNMPGEHNNNECYFPVRIDGHKYRVGEIFDERQAGAPDPIYMFVINGEDYYEKDFHRIEWLNESAPSGEREVDMFAFAEWCKTSNWGFVRGIGWQQYGDPNPSKYLTTAQLYELFKNRNNENS